MVLVVVVVVMVIMAMVVVVVVAVVVEVTDDYPPEASWQEPPQPGKCIGGRLANQCRQCPPKLST